MLEVTCLNNFLNSTNIFPLHLAYSVLQYVGWIERCIFEQTLDYWGPAYHFLTFLTVSHRALFIESREFLQLLCQGVKLNHSVSNSKVCMILKELLRMNLFLYLAIDTEFHPSGIIQNGRRKLLSKSHVQSSNYTIKFSNEKHIGT